MIYLVAAILVIEVLRLILAIDDRRRVNSLNERALRESKSRNKQWETFMKAELEELKELAKGSKTMEKLVQDLQNKEGSAPL